MYLQLIICFIALVLYLTYSSDNSNYSDNKGLKAKTNLYINIMIVILILQSALRNLAVGADTYAYCLRHENLTKTGWDEIFAAFPKTYLEGIGKDPGYSVFEKVIQLFTTDYQIYLFVVAVFFFVGLAKMLKRMNLNLGGVCVAILVYEVLYYDFFSITGIRQTIATGFFFYAFPYLQKRKLIPYVLIMAIGATIHKSCLILLPFYFVAVFNRPRKFLICALIALPFLFGAARAFAVYITSFRLFESYAEYANSTYKTSGAINFTIFLVVTAVLTLMALDKKKSKMALSTTISVNALGLSLLFVPLTWVDPSLMRVGQYFSVFSMFLLGMVLQKVSVKYNLKFQTILFFIFLIFAAVIIKRDQDYAFFWQEMALPENYRNYRI